MQHYFQHACKVDKKGNKSMSPLERKFGKYAIRNLSLVLIILYTCGYIIQAINSSFLSYLTLNPYAVIHGQIWRLVTWLIIPPEQSNIIFIIIMLFFYYSIGTSLERTWGTWRYNVYIFTGVLLMIAGAFLMMLISWLAGDMTGFYGGYSIYFSTYYINMSIFLAYALTFPDAIVLFMFIIPLKVKWLGIIYGAMLAFEFVQYLAAGIRTGNMAYYYLCAAICVSMINFAIFYIRNIRGGQLFATKTQRSFRRGVYGSSSGRSRGSGRYAGSSGRTNGSFDYGRGADTEPSRAQQNASGGGQKAVHMQPQRAMHRCAICGKTELDDPNMEFRYCSKCQGAYEFCSDHLFTHIHAANGEGPKAGNQ